MTEQVPETNSSGKSRSGKARMAKLSPEERKVLASVAAHERWRKTRERIQTTAGISEDAAQKDNAGNSEVIEMRQVITMTANDAGTDPPAGIPSATHWGELQIGSASLPCYVLDTGDRVFSLKGAVVGLIDTEGGQLAEYIKVKSLRPFLPIDLVPRDEDGVKDRIPALTRFDAGGDNPNPAFRFPWGLPVEKFMDLCDAYSRAAEEGVLTERQQRIAITANRFLRACRNIGIIALVDEATGYQKVRPLDELQFKLKLYLEEKMREWEPTFPDELWQQFARLTKWTKPIHVRPKFWGKLVMELIYNYLDPDVAQWLRDNAPKPIHGQNYHQWLSSQYGLKRLVEHIWKVIGVAGTCETMQELRHKMQEIYGKRIGFQYELKLVPPRS